MSSQEYERANASDAANSLPRAREVWLRSLPTWLLMTLTSVWLGFTMFFAWNSTLSNPFVRNIMPSGPAQTITVLNILSHITVFLLQVLTSSVFEILRWAFASTKAGVSAFGFLTMSRATGPLGVLYLLFFDSKTGNFWTGHRLWGVQRFTPS